MKKDYQKPEIEMIALITEEKITDDDIIDGDMGMTSSIF